MTQLENTPASGASERSEGEAFDRRARRARTERMSVEPHGGSTYEVETGSGSAYLVDVEEGRCTCPDHTYRRARCKHIRRVAIEINEGRVPPPGYVEAACEVCGAGLFVERDASEPHLCADHEFAVGDSAFDRNTGDRVLVVGLSELRADEVVIDRERARTVADHYSNAEYDPDVPVVAAVYAQSLRMTEHGPFPDALKVYSFPRSRLSKVPIERGGDGGRGGSRRRDDRSGGVGSDRDGDRGIGSDPRQRRLDVGPAR